MGYETAGRTRLLRRLGTAAGSAAAGLLVLTGCAAGQDTQTTAQTPSIDGIQAEAGNIAIRAAGIASPSEGNSYAKGGSAALRMVLINNGDQADKLVSVSSPAAGGAQLGAGSGASGSTGGSPSATESSSTSAASPSTSASSSTTSGSSSSATASSSASSSASAPSSAEASSSPSASAATTPIDLPARTSVPVGISDGDATVTLTGLTAELFPSQSVPLTLTFASGTSVTVTVAVQLSSASEAPTAPTVTAATQQGGE